ALAGQVVEVEHPRELARLKLPAAQQRQLGPGSRRVDRRDVAGGVDIAQVVVAYEGELCTVPGVLDDEVVAPAVVADDQHGVVLVRLPGRARILPDLPGAVAR